MKYTPHSIKNQEFNRSVRGYDKEEVEAFLDKLSDEFENLIEQNENLTKELDQLNKKIKDYQRIEKNLQETLLSAQESSSKAFDSVKKQTAMILKEAELKAAQIVDRANEEAEIIRNAVANLREEKKLLVSRLKSMIDVQSEVLIRNLEQQNVFSKPKSSEVRKDVKKTNDNINVDDILEKLL